jgi:hypothetical protein
MQVNNAGIIGTIIHDKELFNLAIINRGVSMYLKWIINILSKLLLIFQYFILDNEMKTSINSSWNFDSSTMSIHELSFAGIIGR